MPDPHQLARAEVTARGDIALILTPQQARDLCDVLGGFGWDGGRTGHALYDMFCELANLGDEGKLPEFNTCPPDLAWSPTFDRNRKDTDA